MKDNYMDDKQLINEKEVVIRFNEVDSMGIVWHGSYSNYFEDGREAFGKQYGIGYLYVFNQGYYIPLVNLEFSFKKPLIYGDIALVQTTFVNSDAAKILFEYRILNQKTGELIATGKSVQVFLDHNYQLVLFSPDFYLDWKRKVGILNDL
jgi:acyl-CoA thioester hydrolase